jgi:3',5'-cyclic AMP phosphodiesterase CpdA
MQASGQGGREWGRAVTERLRGVVFVSAALQVLHFAWAAEPFSIVILPDTQFYTSGGSNMLRRFERQVDWIISNRVTRNIRAVLHVGDITESNSPPEWAAASNLLGRLYENDIPCLLTLGNHDLETNGMAHTRQTLLNEYFPWESFTARSYWGGAFETGKLDNAYYYLSMGGVDWIVLALEFGPRDAVLDWANAVLSQNADRAAIVLTHTHVAPDNTLHGATPYHTMLPRDYGLDNQAGHPNNGAEVWEKLIRGQSRMSFIFCGHVLASNGGARCIGTGDYGHVVYQLMSNYQHLNGGDGFLRIVTFFPDESRVDISTYSPFLNTYKLDPDNTFTLRQVRVFDATPPSAVTNLAWSPITSHRGVVTWDASQDAESDIACCVVFLNGKEAGITQSSRFYLSNLTECTTYTVSVQSVNGAGIRSAVGAPLIALSPLDNQPPRIRDVQAGGNKIKIWFTERLDSETATNTAYYRLSNGVAVTQAFWHSASHLVTLFTSPLAPCEAYTLSINGVCDESKSRNAATGLIRRLVAQPVLLWEDFERGNMSGWAVVDEGTMEAPSRWRVTNGVLRQESNIFGPDGSAVTHRRGTYAYWTAPEASAWSQYVFEVTIRTADDDGIGVVFHYLNRSNYCKLDMDFQRAMSKIFEVADGQETTLAFSPKAYLPNTDMVLRLEVNGQSVRAELNGQPIFSNTVATTTLESGSVGLYCWGSQGVEFRHIRVTSTMSCGEQLRDSDEDGLEDGWEQQILSRRSEDGAETIDDILPWDDDDGDGQRNDEEFLAGTDPLDAHSYFRCSLRGDEAGDFLLTWDALSNRIYDVLHSDDLLSPFTDYIGNVRGNVLIIAPNAPSHYFVIRVRPFE